MTAPVHAGFCSGLADEIMVKLRVIAESSRDAVPERARDFASSIADMSTSRIRYDKDRNGVDVKAAAQIKAQRQPDGQFQSPNTKYPALIFEVAFSQNPGNFAKIAEGYMERSGVNTKTFIGINIDYKSRYPSTLSLWKAVNAMETVLRSRIPLRQSRLSHQRYVSTCINSPAPPPRR